MELKQLWSVIKRRWWLILLPAVVALVLTLPTLRASLSPAGSYTTTIRFTASPQPTGTPSNFQDQSYIPWLASEYAVNNIAVWMRTESFAREIVDNLAAQKQTFDVNAVRGAIASDSARSIMTLYLSWPDADQLKLIAQAAIDVLQKRSGAYFPQFSTATAAVTPMDAIEVTPVAPALATRLSPLFRVLIGLVAGIALAFLAEYLDPTIRTRRDAESLGYPIVGELPQR